MIEDPNRIIKGILRDEDDEFEQLEREVAEIQDQLCQTSDAKKKETLRRQLRSKKERVDAAIRFARSV